MKALNNERYLVVVSVNIHDLPNDVEPLNGNHPQSQTDLGIVVYFISELFRKHFIQFLPQPFLLFQGFLYVLKPCLLHV